MPFNLLRNKIGQKQKPARSFSPVLTIRVICLTDPYIMLPGTVPAFCIKPYYIDAVNIPMVQVRKPRPPQEGPTTDPQTHALSQGLAVWFILAPIARGDRAGCCVLGTGTGLFSLSGSLCGIGSLLYPSVWRILHLFPEEITAAAWGLNGFYI